MCRCRMNDGSTWHLDEEVSYHFKMIGSNHCDEKVVHTSVLQECADHREVEVITCNHNGQRKTQTIADELHGHVVDV